MGPMAGVPRKIVGGNPRPDGMVRGLSLGPEKEAVVNTAGDDEPLAVAVDEEVAPPERPGLLVRCSHMR